MSKRLRDPVHGLIVFDTEANLLDRLAWRLIDTPEFQRLRRIRQLGVSEFTFPGAVHTRFAHAIGVFHVARMLVGVIGREMTRQRETQDQRKCEVALIAALLHDVGHGPFSHAFEHVQEARGARKRHEQWTAEIIRNEAGRIRPLLEDFREGFTEQVAGLLEKEDLEDIYHAIVASSFDADRLDYLRRDKLMTGTGAGGIDFDWLMENIRGEGGETVENYLALDDMLVLGALDAMAKAADPVIAEMASRLRERNLYKTLDLAEFGADKGTQASRRRRIENQFAEKLRDGTIIRDDTAAIRIYTEIGGDEERMHKRLHILDGGRPTEISKLSRLIQALEEKKPFRRFYFADKADRDAARK